MKIERTLKKLVSRNLLRRVKKDIQLYEVVGMDVFLEYRQGKKSEVFGQAIMQKKHFYFFRELLKRIVGEEVVDTVFSEVKHTNLVKSSFDYLTTKPFEFLIYSGNIVASSGEYSLEIRDKMIHDEYVSPDEIPF